MGQEKFPVFDIHPNLENSGNPKIIVFMPSVSDSTEYASMIVQAFKNYFVEKLAFDPIDRPAVNVDIILVKGKNTIDFQPVEYEYEKGKLLTLYLNPDDKGTLLNNLLDTSGMYVCEADSDAFSGLKIPLFEDYNDSGVLFLLDGENNIVWRDNDYRGQGEHLKPLEYKIKFLLDISYSQPESGNKELKVGDKAPDLLLEKGIGNISANTGKIRVFTFYPAAFSGVFDINNMARRISMERLSIMSCAIQISSLDRINPQSADVQYYAISESTPEILDNWKRALGTYHISYINDTDYSIALAFGAYNPEGYSNRVTVIIDGEGKIAYVDKDYKISKEKEIQEVIKKLQQKTRN